MSTETEDQWTVEGVKLYTKTWTVRLPVNYFTPYQSS